jgi:hypothetical protein
MTLELGYRQTLTFDCGTGEESHRASVDVPFLGNDNDVEDFKHRLDIEVKTSCSLRNQCIGHTCLYTHDGLSAIVVDGAEVECLHLLCPLPESDSGGGAGDLEPRSPIPLFPSLAV